MLTEKQKRFVEEYIIDANATQAAIRAGYKPKNARATGAENLTKPYIRAAIDEALERMHDQRTADAREVMEYLTSVLRGESRAHVLSLCGDGYQEVIDKPPDEKERLKAAELLGKRYALFNDRINLQGALPVVISGGEELED